MTTPPADPKRAPSLPSREEPLAHLPIRETPAFAPDELSALHALPEFYRDLLLRIIDECPEPEDAILAQPLRDALTLPAAPTRGKIHWLDLRPGESLIARSGQSPGNLARRFPGTGWQTTTLGLPKGVTRYIRKR